MKKKIAVLPGDGIGPEIMAEALKVLGAVEQKFDHEFEYVHGLIGGAAWDDCGEHFPKETIELCNHSDAILFGSAGGPVDDQNSEKWLDCERNTVLGIRKKFKFNINLRPIKIYPALVAQCPLREEIVSSGVDILCVRELSGGIYFGEHKLVEDSGYRVATDVMEYDEHTIRSVAEFSFKAAMKRSGKVTSVDKANVLDCSRLWRKVVDETAIDYPDCQYEHMLVDNCAMQIITRPSDFDVMLLPNMFGDILSDELSVLSGSLGMLPSASFNNDGEAMYEPAGGSAHDIAGQGIANPVGQILSAAMMLNYSFGLSEEHDAIVTAVNTALNNGFITRDLNSDIAVTTSEMGSAIADGICP